MIYNHSSVLRAYAENMPCSDLLVLPVNRSRTNRALI